MKALNETDTKKESVDYDEIMNKIKTGTPCELSVCDFIACIDNYPDFNTTICVDEILDFVDANDILFINVYGYIYDKHQKVSGRIIKRK